jgi:hypothetical protein
MTDSIISRSVPGIFADHPLLSLVHVFKTNISTTQKVEEIASLLSGEYRILRWNIDLYDVDNVLRIESKELTSAEIIEMICQVGFECEELPD